MKSLLTLHLSTLRNLGDICSIGITRDLTTVTNRCKDEGDGFLTITLPKLAKALERGLDTGSWDAKGVTEFDHIRGLPAFMRGFLSAIFDETTGVLLDTPDPDCIWAVRQFCLLTSKVERDCTPARERAAFDAFVSTDRELLGLPGRLSPERLATFVATSSRFFGRVFQECDLAIANYSLVPKHGPGAVAEKLSQKDRRRHKEWPDRLEDVFPYWRYTANSVYRSCTMPITQTDERPVRVVSVPKTQLTPRIIAIEPAAMQYAQQGLKRELYELIGRGPLAGILGFQDQERNRALAEESSITGHLSTIDLSEASDRVHWFLIYSMLKAYPHLCEFVLGTRSVKADVPFHGVIPLQKFASMGSALTFPMEAIVFTVLTICGVEQAHTRRYTPQKLRGVVSVYGDDIISPVDSIDLVIDWLEHFGAKVNRRKSFWNGKFRESCGAEFYDGHDVSVVRLRHEFPNSRDDAAGIANLVDFRNRAYSHGLWSVVKEVDEELENLIRLPYARIDSSARDGYIHRVTSLPISRTGSRWDPNLQVDVRRVPILTPVTSSYKVDGEEGLLEWFHDALSRGDLVDRFAGQERASSFNIKRREVQFL